MRIAHNPKSTLWRFGFRTTWRGALLLGILMGGMVAMQALAFAATYTNDLARENFATALVANPALGILYGEIRHIETPAGYMVYRTLPFLALLGGIWALTVTTRLLRGQEEDGRMELLLIGSHSLASATRELLKGLAVSLGITYVTAALLLVALGQSASIQVPVTASLFFATALCMPAAVCIGIGALVSQLASTRRRAITYGTTLLIIFFALRSIGNIVPSLSWLKYCTPFGWTDKLHPITGSDAVWLLPLVALTMLAACLALLMARRRDLGDSIITDDGTAPARTALLGGPFGFGLRMNRGSLVAWCMAIAAISGLITAIAKTAADALTDSPSLTKALGAITGGSTGLAIAFIGFGGFFTALLLMLMVTNSIGRIREDESKGYADNFLVGPISRARWLGSRIVLIACSTVVLCIVANSICLLVARAQGIPVSSGAMLLGGLNYIGPALLVIGVGTLLFGIVPRLASPVLYAWVGWSFIVEMLGSVVVLPAYTYNTSLLRHISIVPATQPDWKLFAIICLCGTIAGVTGILLFARRDLVGE